MGKKERIYIVGDSAEGKCLTLIEKITSESKINLYIFKPDIFNNNPSFIDELDEWEKGKHVDFPEHSHTVLKIEDSNKFPEHHRDIDTKKSELQHIQNSKKKIDIYNSEINFLESRIPQLAQDSESDYVDFLDSLKRTKELLEPCDSFYLFEKTIQDYENSKDSKIQSLKIERIKMIIDQAKTKIDRINDIAEKYKKCSKQKREFEYINPKDANQLINRLNVLINICKNELNPKT